MKFRLQNRQAFTLIEIIVSIMVFSGFVLAIMFVYSRSSDSFKITAWKQERVAQAEHFWSRTRKALEEATDLIYFDPLPNTPPKKELRPIKIHPAPESAPDGNILAWNVSKTNYDMATSNHTSVHNICSLVKQGRRLIVRSAEGQESILDDVVDIKFVVSSVMKTADNAEEIQPVINSDAVVCISSFGMDFFALRKNFSTASSSVFSLLRG